MGAPSKKASQQSTTLKIAIQDSTSRRLAKDAFDAHQQAAAGDDDVLSRCKKLNEFLAGGFMKGGHGGSTGNNKEQVKEMLAILNAGPKRPSFLDKPPVTASMGKKQQPATSATASPPHLTGPPSISGKEADRLLGILESSECCISAPQRTANVPSMSSEGPIPHHQEEMDDLIGLLNENVPMSVACRPRSAVLDQEERSRLDQQLQMQKDREKKEAEKKALEDTRLIEVENERRRKEEQQKLEQQQQQALEQARQEAQRSYAAVQIQRYVRVLLAKKTIFNLRELKRQRELAAVSLQAAFRARAARDQLHSLRVDDFRCRHAARLIAAGYLHYRNQWRLNPVHGPVRGGPSACRANLDGHSHLLERPLRLRSMADTRLAPEATANTAGGTTDMILGDPSGKRTVATARVRADKMMKDQDRQKEDVSARALMAVSEHRDFTSAMEVVKAGVR